MSVIQIEMFDFFRRSLTRLFSRTTESSLLHGNLPVILHQSLKVMRTSTFQNCVVAHERWVSKLSCQIMLRDHRYTLHKRSLVPTRFHFQVKHDPTLTLHLIQVGDVTVVSINRVHGFIFRYGLSNLLL